MVVFFAGTAECLCDKETNLKLAPAICGCLVCTCKIETTSLQGDDHGILEGISRLLRVSRLLRMAHVFPDSVVCIGSGPRNATWGTWIEVVSC